MSIGTANRRQRRTAWAALSLFVAVWLNMALQPCLMAAEPLLPESHEDCPHCPEIAHCDDDARCGFIDAYDFDAREAVTAGDPPFIAAFATIVPTAMPAFTEPVAACPEPAGLDPGPPLFLKHCQFLN